MKSLRSCRRCAPTVARGAGRDAAGLLVLAVRSPHWGPLQRVPLVADPSRRGRAPAHIRVAVGTQGSAGPRDGWTIGIGEQQSRRTSETLRLDGLPFLAVQGVSLEGLEIAVIVPSPSVLLTCDRLGGDRSAASVLLIGALGAASYRLVGADSAASAAKLLSGRAVTPSNVLANEGLGAGWPGGTSRSVVGVFYIAAALVLVRVVSYWRRGTPRSSDRSRR